MSGYIDEDAASDAAMAHNEDALLRHSQKLYNPNIKHTCCAECGDDLVKERVEMGASHCVPCLSLIEKKQRRYL